MRKPPLERVTDEIEFCGTRKGFHQQIVRPRQYTAPLLDAQPFTNRIGQQAPFLRMRQHFAHTARKKGGKRKLAAIVGGNLRLRIIGAADEGSIVANTLKAQHVAGKDEGVARGEAFEKILLHAAEHAPARPHRLSLPQKAYIQHRVFDDHTRIQAVLPGDTRMRNTPQTIRGFAQTGITVITRQRITAGGDKVHRIVEILARQGRIGRRGDDFGIKRIGIERRRTGHTQNMLGEHIKTAGAQAFAIQFARQHRVAGGLTLQHLKTVGGHQQRAGRFIQPVIGAADALYQTRGPFRRTDADDTIHRAPIDAEIEGGGTDHRAQHTTRHCGFHLAPLFLHQRAMMQRDRQMIIIDTPQFLKSPLRLCPCVDEDQRGL